jgi:hypothetical protein
MSVNCHPKAANSREFAHFGENQRYNMISIIKWLFMRKTEARGQVSNSPANPLPAAFYDAKFRCRQARSNCIQPADLLKILDTERAHLGS